MHPTALGVTALVMSVAVAFGLIGLFLRMAGLPRVLVLIGVAVACMFTIKKMLDDIFPSRNS